MRDLRDLREIVRAHMWTHNSTARDGQGRLYGWTDAEINALLLDLLESCAWERENDLYNRYDRVGKPRPTGASASPYDACGCIAPCPDHQSPAQDGKRDRDYWNDHPYSSEEPG